MTTRLLDTLRRIEAAPALRAKTAAEAAPPREPSEGELLRKVAEVLRARPDPEVTDADLYAVLKVAEEAPRLAPLAVDGSRPSDQLRKLAYALRAADAQERDARLEKAAHMIRAAQALTLLRDRVRAL